MKAKTVLAAIAAMMMVAVMMMPAVAAEQTNITAVVTGAGTDPVIEEIFELDNNGISAPTTVSPDPITGFKEVCVYVVMSDATGASTITDVEITVSLGVTQKAYGDTLSGDVYNVTGSDVNTATQAAYDQGLIDTATQGDINTKCASGLWRMQKFCFDMSSCDKAGDYDVYVIAYDEDGNEGSDSNYFVYDSLKHLEIDFTTINFGTITPGAEASVYGDNDTATPGAPTVSSCANDPFALMITATDMTNGGPSAIIYATSQYACVHGVDGSSSATQKLPLDTTGVTFNPIIGACEDEPIDFFVLQSSILKGTYDGTITLEVV